MQGLSSTPRTSFERLRGYLLGIVATAVSGAICQLGSRYFQLADVIMIHLMAVVVISMRFGMGPSLFTAVVSNLSFDFFFVPPSRQFNLPDVQSLVTFSVMLAVAIVISGLNERLRREKENARLRESRTAALYSMSRELSIVRTMDQLVAVATRHVERMFGARAIILLADADGTLRVPSSRQSQLDPADASLAEAAWSRRDLVAGSAESGCYVPLLGSHEPVGVLGVVPSPIAERPELRELLETCSHQTATAIERTLQAKDAQRAQVQIETERLRSSLLSAVSHDLKTPLTAILSAARTLSKNQDGAGPSSLIYTVVEEAERLDGLVTNVLALTRLESGTVEIHKRDEAIDEVIGSALRRLTERLRGRAVHTDVPVETPLVPMDPMLIEQVIINLLENAIKYTPSHSPLDIRALREGMAVKVELDDRGLGIPFDEREKVFEKFYRGRGVAGDGGMGLGLTICRAIVAAHGGRIAIHDRAGGGTSVQFTLPCSPVNPIEVGGLPELGPPEEQDMPKNG
jgi:two-component system sensor histidine kinase KdpD